VNNPAAQDGLKKLRARFGASDDSPERNLIWVALGDSVTAGCTVGPGMLGEEVYHAVVARELERLFPGSGFDVINAGVGGDNTVGGLVRLQADVLDHSPDLVTICFGLNDSGKGEAGLDLFERNLVEIVERVRAIGAAVVLMTPNMMVTRPNQNVPPEHAETVGDFIQRQTGGLLDRYVERIRAAAGATSSPLADAYAEWQRRHQAGEDTTALLENGLNHPGAEGHRILAAALLEAILS
jgi:acyl-CoA thioesterase I